MAGAATTVAHAIDAPSAQLRIEVHALPSRQ